MSFEKQFNNPITNPGLQISAWNLLVEAANAFLYKVDGNISPLVAAGQVLPALTDSIADGFQAAYTFYAYYNTDTATNVFSVEKSSNVSNSSLIDFSDFASDDSNQAILGYVLIRNDSWATFVGGTTPLNTVGLEVNYINNFGVVGL